MDNKEQATGIRDKMSRGIFLSVSGVLLTVVITLAFYSGSLSNKVEAQAHLIEGLTQSKLSKEVYQSDKENLHHTLDRLVENIDCMSAKIDRLIESE